MPRYPRLGDGGLPLNDLVMLAAQDIDFSPLAQDHEAILAAPLAAAWPFLQRV